MVGVGYRNFDARRAVGRDTAPRFAEEPSHYTVKPATIDLLARVSPAIEMPRRAQPAHEKMSDPRAPARRGEVSALILSGGRGRRLGGVDKGLYAVGGRALIEHVLERIEPQVADCLISANRNLARYAVYGHPVVGDDNGAFDGPLAGVAAALGRVRGEWLATAPCDAPAVSKVLIERLLDAALARSADICCADDGERLQPTFCLYHRRVAPSLRAYLARGGRKIDRFFPEHRFATADFSDAPGSFANLNTRGEIAAFESGLGPDEGR